MSPGIITSSPSPSSSSPPPAVAGSSLKNSFSAGDSRRRTAIARSSSVRSASGLAAASASISSASCRASVVPYRPSRNRSRASSKSSSARVAGSSRSSSLSCRRVGSACGLKPRHKLSHALLAGWLELLQVECEQPLDHGGEIVKGHRRRDGEKQLCFRDGVGSNTIVVDITLLTASFLASKCVG